MVFALQQSRAGGPLSPPPLYCILPLWGTFNRQPGDDRFYSSSSSMVASSEIPMQPMTLCAAGHRDKYEERASLASTVFPCGTLRWYFTRICVILRMSLTFSISPSTSAQYRSSGVGIPFPARTLASVPIIQAATALIIWSSVAGCSSSGSSL